MSRCLFLFLQTYVAQRNGVQAGSDGTRDKFGRSDCMVLARGSADGAEAEQSEVEEPVGVQRWGWGS